jgi:exosortase/archaeosortase family protein
MKDTVSSIINSGWVKKYPVLVFFCLFFAIMALFYAFTLSDFYNSTFQPFIVNINARIAGIFLRIFGENASVYGDLITSGRTSISVKRGCDALIPIFLFISAVMAFPAPFRRKATGVFWGILFLVTVNIVRIVSLYYTNIFYPQYFDLMHLEVWQVIFIGLGIACWAIWMQWIIKKAQTKLA